MAAYIRLASRSQAKLQNNRNWVTCLAQPHLRRARHPPICHFNFRLAHVRRWIWHALSQWPSQAFQSLIRSWFVAAYLARQLVAGVVAFDVILALNSTLLWLVWTVTHFWQQGKMVESHDRSSSMEPQLKFPGCSHFRRRSDNHYRCQQCCLNDGLTLCTQDSPCEVCKDWLPEAWQALERATRQKQKCKAAAAAKKSHDMDYSIEIHAPEDGLPPIKQREDESSRHKDLAKRAKTATSSTSMAMEAKSTDRPSRSRDKKSKTVSSSVSVVGRSSRSDGGHGPPGTKGSECHRSHSGERGRRDRSHGSERHHDSPRSRHSPRRRESGERARPMSSSGGSSSRSKQADSADLPGSDRASGRVTDVRPSSTHHQHHHPRTSVYHGPCPLHLRHRLIVGPCPSLIIIMEDVRALTRTSLGCPMCPDGMWNCLQSYRNHLRLESSQLCNRHPGQQGVMTRQLWRARRTRQRLPTRQVWRARWTWQQTMTQQVMSRQETTTRQVMSQQ